MGFFLLANSRNQLLGGLTAIIYSVTTGLVSGVSAHKLRRYINDIIHTELSR